MKLVMTLLVRDEEDILDDHLRYHFAQGVDHVIVTDNLSVDRTPEILAGYQAEDRVSVIREESDDYSQRKWVTRMARSAFLDHGADWVVNSDADEFWWPLGGNLMSTLAALPPEVGFVRVPRTDFVPVADDGRPFYTRMVARDSESVNALGRPLPPKVCHRGHSEIEVSQGNHTASGLDLEVFEGPCPIVIFHFPLRSYKQFENKIVKGGRAYERNTELGPSTGDAWRNLYRLYQAGGLHDYYQSRERSAAEIEEGLQSGTLVRDDRLRRFLESQETRSMGTRLDRLGFGPPDSSSATGRIKEA